MEKIFSRCKGKLIKLIKDSGGEFDYYSISTKIRQTLLHWYYELKKKICCNFFSLNFLFFLLYKNELLSI